MTVDKNAIIIEATLGITPQDLSYTIRNYLEESGTCISYIIETLDKFDEDAVYDVSKVINELNYMRSEANDDLELSKEVAKLIGKIDQINEFNQAILLNDDLLRIINEIKETVDCNSISNQENLISTIKNMEEELSERKEISNEEVMKIYDEIRDELYAIY